MSSKTLDEYADESLEQELQIRKARRAIGNCDYCNRPGVEPSCRFRQRHMVARLWHEMRLERGDK